MMEAYAYGIRVMKEAKEDKYRNIKTFDAGFSYEQLPDNTDQINNLLNMEL